MKLISYVIFFLSLTSCFQNRKKNISKQPGDELHLRIKMASERLVFGKEPEMIEDFLLAGVTLDTSFGVRFSEFSSDQAGRYLSKFSQISANRSPIDLDTLVKKIITTQKPDGRFGSESLVFDPAKPIGN